MPLEDAGTDHRVAASKKASDFMRLNRWLVENESENAGARTQDLRIKSPLLYQLSYVPDFES